MKLLFLVAFIFVVIGGLLWWTLQDKAKLSENIEEYKRREQARRKVDEYARKRQKQARDLIDSTTDKLDPWV